jgi:hypothetical protein
MQLAGSTALLQRNVVKPMKLTKSIGVVVLKQDLIFPQTHGNDLP